LRSPPKLLVTLTRTLLVKVLSKKSISTKLVLLDPILRKMWLKLSKKCWPRITIVLMDLLARRMTLLDMMVQPSTKVRNSTTRPRFPKLSWSLLRKRTTSRILCKIKCTKRMRV
jgi:hypothetical protein